MLGNRNYHGLATGLDKLIDSWYKTAIHQTSITRTNTLGETNLEVENLIFHDCPTENGDV